MQTLIRRHAKKEMNILGSKSFLFLYRTTTKPQTSLSKQFRPRFRRGVRSGSTLLTIYPAVTLKHLQVMKWTCWILDKYGNELRGRNSSVVRVNSVPLSRLQVLADSLQYWFKYATEKMAFNSDTAKKCKRWERVGNSVIAHSIIKVLRISASSHGRSLILFVFRPSSLLLAGIKGKQDITKTCLYNFDSPPPNLNPAFYSKIGVYRGIHYFSYFCSIHRL